jgi:hypothetical protein
MSEICMEDLADLDQPHTSIIQETLLGVSIPIPSPTTYAIMKQKMFAFTVPSISVW